MQAPKPTLQSSWFRIVARGAFWRRKTSGRNTPAGMTPQMHPAREGIPWENRGSRVGLPRVLAKKKKCKKAKWLSGEALQIAVKRRDAKSKGEKERYKRLNAEFQRMAKER